MSEVHDGGLRAANQPSLQKILKGISPELLDQPCQDKHLCEVACHVTNWLSLAPFLRISEAEENVILGNWPRNTAKQKIDCFRKWQEKRGRKATYQRLCEAVWKAGEYLLAEKVCDIVTSQNNSDSESGEDEYCTVEASTPPLPPKPKPQSKKIVSQPFSIHSPPFPPPRDSQSTQDGRSPPQYHTDPPTPTNSESDPLNPYINYLRDMYDIICPQFLVLQWPPPPTRKVFNLAMIQSRDVQPAPVDEELVRLLQRGNIAQYTRERVSVQLKDLFTLDQKKRKIILIEGAPGSGKSTLAWHGCQQWKAGELFQEFKMVVFVQLRDSDVQSAKSIADLLLAGSEKRRRDAAHGIEACEGGGVLFVLDGWDEYGPGLNADSIVSKLICNPDKLEVPYSSLIITCRPIASAVLQPRASSRVEIVGFTPEEVGQYFREVVQDPVAVKSLQDQLRAIPVIEASCYLPLNAVILAHLFIGLKHTLPRTFYGIFSALVCGCIIRYLTKKSGKEGDIPEISSLDKLPLEVQAPFENLCILAFEASVKNKATFSSEDLSFHGVSVEGNGLGLMQGVQSFLSGKSDSYHFLHLSVQELLAAVHVSKLSAVDQVSVFRELFSKPRLVAIFRFFAALTKLQTEVIREVVANVIIASKPQGYEVNEWRQWRRGVLNILHCLYEAQDVTLCLFVASLLEGDLDGLDLCALCLSPLDCLCIGYFLCCVCAGREGKFAVKLQTCGLGLDSCSVGFLVKELCKCSGVGVSRGSSKAVVGSLELDLYYNNIDGSGVRQLCELMNSPSVLRRLRLSQNRIQDGEDGLFYLLQVLRSNHSLVEVKLVNCSLRIDGDTGPAFVEMLQNNHSLKVLELGGNYEIGDVGVDYIAEGITGRSGVVGLGLQYCGIGAEGGKVVGKLLTENRTLESLNLGGNVKLGDVGLKEVSKGMTVNYKLEELNIADCGCSLDCLKEFVSTLKENCQLRKLGVEKEEVDLLEATVNNLRRQRKVVEVKVVDGWRML